MTNMFNLYEMLHEIEDITDLNGSFFVNAENNTVIESTIHSQIPEKILWEIGVLRDTFQQFANEVNHGEITELMLEGDKGYVLLYNIPPHLILLTMASYDINLSYVKLAMIDILKRIRGKILKFGDEILRIPAAEPSIITQKVDIEPEQVIPEQIPPEQVIPEHIPPEQVIPEHIPPEQVIPEQIPPEQVIPEQIPPEQVIPEQIPPEQVIPEQATLKLETGDDLNVLMLINSLENKTSDDQYII
ncbi:MAG: hypothetical protein ACFFG0_30990, partial [Candidatus Thorarchaeota archaeon]